VTHQFSANEGGRDAIYVECRTAPIRSPVA
jgi:hypothetical protein